MQDAIEPTKVGPLTARVVYDEGGFADSPREWTNLGTIVAWSDRYNFGDENLRYRPDENYGAANYGTMRNFLVAEYDAIAETIRPIVVSNYNGTLTLGDFDWEMADGAIFVTPSAVEEVGTDPEHFAEVLDDEVKLYNQWATGEVYGWIVEDEGGTELDSVWGYIGETEYPMQEARATAESRPEYRRAAVGAFAGSEGLGL